MAPAVPMRFTKMHGAGNDFVVLDLRGGQAPPDPALSRVLADRHRGVGCDQILTIEAPRSLAAVAAYRIWNADGSNAAQCGNGARCVAAWLVRAGCVDGDRFELDSPSGTHAVERLANGRFRVAMGIPDFAPQSLPLRGFAHAQDHYVLAIDSRLVRLGAVSMGNPHVLVDVADIGVDDLARAPVAELGAALQAQPVFPDSVNVGFAQVQSRARVALRVFERGAGETLACGSGACAAAAILMRRDWIERRATIALPGGELQIDWPGDDRPITMAGPATFVFEGEFPA